MTATVKPSASMQYHPRRQLIAGRLFSLLKYVVLIVLSISFVLPFYWMFVSALKDDSQVYTVPPIWVPHPAYWNNFYDAWVSQPFTLYLFNTIFKYAIPYTIGAVLASAVVAYGFSRIRWRGRDALFFLCLATMMVPFQVTDAGSPAQKLEETSFRGYDRHVQTVETVAALVRASPFSSMVPILDDEIIGGHRTPFRSVVSQSESGLNSDNPHNEPGDES
jgi:hypothetical protein